MNPQPSLLELLAAYEGEHAFMRRLVLPRDDGRCITQWHGGYRWFSDSKIVCIEKIRLVKARQYRRLTSAA
jgi:hypothetical protein